MIEIRDTETNAVVEIDRLELKQILTAASCHNIGDIEKLEAATFGGIIKDGKYIGLVETQLSNHLDNWKFCCKRRDKIDEVEKALEMK